MTLNDFVKATPLINDNQESKNKASDFLPCMFLNLYVDIWSVCTSFMNILIYILTNSNTDGVNRKKKKKTLLNNQMKSYKQDINKTLKNQQPAFTCIKLAL